MSYETFEHTADLGLRVRGGDLDELFADAARGLFSMIVDLAAVRPAQTVEIRVDGAPSEYLLFDWLNELLYVYDVRRLLLAQFQVRVGSDGLVATARGEPIDESRHALEHEVKAITYHGLKLEQHDGAYLAEVIVDI